MQREMEPVFSVELDIMPVILVPMTESCQNCKGKLRTDARPSQINVFFADGLKTGHCYHKKCAECGLLVYNSFNKKVGEHRVFNPNAGKHELFMLSAKTAISKLLLQQIINMIEVSAITFQGISDYYLAMSGYTLDKQRIEEAYFLSKLLNIYNDFDMPLKVHYNADSCRKDLERLSKEAVEKLVNISTDYESHQCSTPGCREGFIMADGIEKVSSLNSGLIDLNQFF